MVIETREFGFIEIDEKDIIHFPYGIYGFEDIKDYVILRQDTDNDDPVMWMQAVNNIHIRFVVLDPLFVVDAYNPELPGDVLKELNVRTYETLRYFLIAVVPKDIRDMTVNMKSPIVLNPENNKAVQVILEDANYSVRYYLFRGNEVAQPC